MNIVSFINYKNEMSMIDFSLQNRDDYFHGHTMWLKNSEK